MSIHTYSNRSYQEDLSLSLDTVSCVHSALQIGHVLLMRSHGTQHALQHTCPHRPAHGSID